jgi:hypothetical protein
MACPRCQGVTAAGARCKRVASCISRAGSLHCHSHLQQASGAGAARSVNAIVETSPRRLSKGAKAVLVKIFARLKNALENLDLRTALESFYDGSYIADEILKACTDKRPDAVLQRCIEDVIDLAANGRAGAIQKRHILETLDRDYDLAPLQRFL